MKNFNYALIYCVLLLSLLPLSGYGQCSNQVTLSYYDNAGVRQSQVINNGQSGTNVAVCPSAGALYNFTSSSTSDAVQTWARVITRGATSAADVVQVLSSATLVRNTDFNLAVSFSTTTTLRLEANTILYPGSNCGKDDFVYLTFTPSLTLTSPGVGGICAGTSTSLTASGSASGTYAWTANGVTIPNQTGATITVAPTATTTYTVTATTAACGASSQQLTIPVYELLVSPAAPTTCANQIITLTASYTGTSATYRWTELGQTTALSTTATLTVAPGATTTYRVVATTADCGVFTRSVTVTVGAATVAAAPAAATSCAGGATTLTATSTNPAATYSWAPATGLSATTGASVTARPTVNTIYTVTATTACGTATSSVTVTVAAPTFAVSPTSAATCSGGATTLTASTNQTAATYAWTETSKAAGTVISTAPTLTVAPTVTATTTYTYQVVTTTPCATDTRSVSVTVSPSVSVTPTAATIVVGGATTLTANGATAYTWSPATGLNTTTGAVVTASPTYTTTYTVTGNIAATGTCTNTRQVTVTVNRPLPVSLVSFEAKWVARQPQLTWTTASERNNAYFDVERSLDGNVFEPVGRRTGTGTTTGQTTYGFTDASLPQAVSRTVYYRLQQVDIDGKAHYSPLRSVVAPGATGSFQALVFPNPYENAATVQFRASDAGAVVMTLQNVLGQVLATGIVPATGGEQEAALPRVASLPPGLYFLTLRQGSQQQRLPVVRR